MGARPGTAHRIEPLGQVWDTTDRTCSAPLGRIAPHMAGSIYIRSLRKAQEQLRRDEKHGTRVCRISRRVVGKQSTVGSRTSLLAASVTVRNKVHIVVAK